MNCAMRCFLALILPASALLATDPTEPSLREAAGGRFDIGFGSELPTPARAALVAHHGNSLTTENSLKFHMLRPTEHEWKWDKADALIDFAVKGKLEIVGHTLVWCYQMPKWVTAKIASGELDKAAALRLQDEHIRTVLARHGDRIGTWDVVNEALADDGDYLRDDPWSTLCGEDYIIEAFRSARAAAPQARLLYNDFNLEAPAKRARLFRLLGRLEAEGLRPDGIGLQGHYSLTSPSVAGIEAAIEEIHAAGYPVHFTELDISVYKRAAGADLERREYRPDSDPGYAVLPDDLHEALAGRYADLFRLFVRQADKIERVTFWNVDDGTSWLNNWPLKGRPDHPLLFDRQQKPKPAFHAVLRELTGNAETSNESP